VSFTGSTATGKKVLHSTVETMKRFTLELGGNDAGIILDDANIDLLGPKIFWSAFYNAAQICYATKRLFVPRKMMDRVCDLFVKMCESQKVGDGLVAGTTMGPIQNKLQYDKVMGYIEDAKANGKILCGGHALPGDGYFIAPTIVRDIADSARVVKEEQFGPVLPILSYDDIDDVIARANNSEYGLGASVWTADPKRGIEVASRLETGTCWVNQHFVFPPDVYYGGAKQSGLGKQNGPAGMEDFTQFRIVNASLV
jgi:acyl-CoA reductase-like NAD-dependent aldehyde dehydrogenase